MNNVVRVCETQDAKCVSYIKEVKSTGKTTIFRLGGSVDAQTLPVKVTGKKCCAGKKRKNMKRSSNRNIILDLRDVTHVDSATLAAFLLLLSDLNKKGKKLGFVNMFPMLKKYMRMSGLESYFQVYTSEKTALDVMN